MGAGFALLCLALLGFAMASEERQSLPEAGSFAWLSVAVLGFAIAWEDS